MYKHTQLRILGLVTPWPHMHLPFGVLIVAVVEVVVPIAVVVIVVVVLTVTNTTHGVIRGTGRDATFLQLPFRMTNARLARIREKAAAQT